MSFIDRHLGPRSADAEQMLKALGYDSLGALMDDAVPPQIRPFTASLIFPIR